VIRDTVTETVVYVGPHYEVRFTKNEKPEDLDGDVNDDGTVEIGDV
jgi:hypothetical protein